MVGAARALPARLRHERMARRHGADPLSVLQVNGRPASLPSSPSIRERPGLPARCRYLRIAGEQALGRGAYREATDHLERALSLLPKLPSSAESLVLELELYIPLGTALGSTKGYAAPEVERIYARARQLCDVVGQTPCHFPVLAGMISFYLVRADYRTTGEVAEHFVRLARAQAGDGVQSVAHMTLGYNCLHRARLAEARYHLELAVARHKPEHGDFPAGSYKHAPEAAARAELPHIVDVRLSRSGAAGRQRRPGPGQAPRRPITSTPHNEFQTASQSGS